VKIWNIRQNCGLEQQNPPVSSNPGAVFQAAGTAAAGSFWLYDAFYFSSLRKK